MQIKIKYDRKNRQRETHNFTFLRLGSWRTLLVSLLQLFIDFTTTQGLSLSTFVL